jgi:asparaginyl-tRNA synthetase
VRDDPRAPGGKEIAVQALRVIAPAAKWPITRSAVRSSSFLYDKRHLSIRGRKASAVFRIRAELVYAAFDFFTRRGFVLISAPTLVQNAVEGGTTLFQLDYFGQPAYLSQSAQLYEEAAICALEKVFIYQPAFRAEKSKTSKHLTEFWMLEAEQAFAEQADNLRLQEELVGYLVERVVERCGPELRVLGRSMRVPARPFPRIPYDEVRERAAQKGVQFQWGEDIPTEAERLISSSFEDPVFVTDYPLSARSFYHMTKDSAGRITLSADLFAPEGFGEIATGGQRVHDYDVLVDRVKGQEIPPESFEWYLELRKYGLPPHSGFGLGIERTVRWLAGLKHIRAASLFPRTLTRIRP